MAPNFRDLVGVLIGILIWLLILFIVYTFMSAGKDDVLIETDKPLVPEIQLTITDNKVDTLYIYRKP